MKNGKLTKFKDDKDVVGKMICKNCQYQSDGVPDCVIDGCCPESVRGDEARKMQEEKIKIERELFERIEKEFFGGWEEVYDIMFSKQGMVNQEDWFEFKKKVLARGKDEG